MFKSLLFLTLIGATLATRLLDQSNFFQQSSLLASSGCSAAGTPSCQNDTEVPDLCCFEAPGVRRRSLYLRIWWPVTNTFASFQGLLLQTQVSLLCRHTMTCHWSFSSSGTPILPLGHMTAGPYTVSHQCQNSESQYSTYPFFTGLWPDKCVIIYFGWRSYIWWHTLAATQLSKKIAIHLAITEISVPFVFHLKSSTAITDFNSSCWPTMVQAARWISWRKWMILDGLSFYLTSLTMMVVLG